MIQILSREERDRLDRHLQRGVDARALAGFHIESRLLLWASLRRWLAGESPLYRVEHEIAKKITKSEEVGDGIEYLLFRGHPQCVVGRQ